VSIIFTINKLWAQSRPFDLPYLLSDNPLFNAGKGAVFNSAGFVRVQLRHGRLDGIKSNRHYVYSSVCLRVKSIALRAASAIPNICHGRTNTGPILPVSTPSGPSSEASSVSTLSSLRKSKTRTGVPSSSAAGACSGSVSAGGPEFRLLTRILGTRTNPHSMGIKDQINCTSVPGRSVGTRALRCPAIRNASAASGSSRTVRLAGRDG
jgi:hypothetical protein